MSDLPAENYFEFYGLPVSFELDGKDLRQKYLSASKRHHPDFFAGSQAGEQERALRLSTFNNEAYRTLSDFDTRMKYVLQLAGMLEGGGKDVLPPDFLAQMLEINENLMELEMEPDEAKCVQLREEVRQIEADLGEGIMPLLETYKHLGPGSAGTLIKAKEFFLKRRYLLRIHESLDKFASAY